MAEHEHAAPDGNSTAPVAVGAGRRRTALGVLAAVLGASVAVAVPAHPDAELIRLADEFCALERAWQATFDGEGDSWEDPDNQTERSRLRDLQEPFVEQMEELRAATLAGVIARAQALTLWAPDVLEKPYDTETSLRYTVIRDLLALGGSLEEFERLVVASGPIAEEVAPYVLPEPKPHSVTTRNFGLVTVGDFRLLGMLAAMSVAEADAWICAGQRINQGMSTVEAEQLFHAEIAASSVSDREHAA